MLGTAAQRTLFCRRMAAKKKELVLQVSSSRAFSRPCKLSKCKGWSSVLGCLRFCWQSPSVRSLWGRGVPGGRWDTWEDLAGHTCPQSGLWGAEGAAAGCVWGCWGLAQVWLLSETKIPLFCEVIAHRTFRSLCGGGTCPGWQGLLDISGQVMYSDRLL